MTRLMLFVVIAVAMAVLAIQNQDTAALTILGTQQTPEIPFGLLLVGAFSIGALLTLFLYSIVGLQRPPESKYRPMGRRVPYPDSPGNANLSGLSDPPANTGSPYATASQSYGRSTAFVNEPSPQDAARTTPRSNDSNRGEAADSSVRSTPIQPSVEPAVKPPAEPSVEQSRFTPPVSSKTTASPTPTTSIDKPKSEKKKRRFTALGRKRTPEPKADKRIGNDWGELRTAEHINSWEANEARQTAGIDTPADKRGLLDFIGVGTSAMGSAAKNSQPAEQLADDIAAGWDETAGNYSYENGPYEDALDSGWEQGYGPENYGPERYGQNSAPDVQKRVYRDGIYSEGDYDSEYMEGPYEQGPYDQTPYEQGPYETDKIDAQEEGVYEADYRVIVPPSKPLEEISPQNSDRADEPYD